jgi:hypothetical protein
MATKFIPARSSGIGFEVEDENALDRDGRPLKVSGFMP